MKRFTTNMVKLLRVLMLIVALALVLAMLTGCYPVVAAQEEAPGTLQGFLGRLLGSTGIGAFIYFVLEDLPYLSDWFDACDSKLKRLIVLLASFAVPLAALSIGVWRGYYFFTDDSVFQALAAGFEAFTVSQIIHMRSV
jgi:hypothetical protein